MRRVVILIFALIILLIITVLSINQKAASARYDAGLPRSPNYQRPTHGWRVCGDMGTGSVPGVGVRQRFRVCQGDDWVILAYCLEPDKPPPAEGTMCSFVNSSNLWCGANVQTLQEYAVLQTPIPSETPTSTRTSTRTGTATLTQTSTSTTTATQTRTSTPPTGLTRQAPPATRTKTAATPLQRPKPGGPGNLEALILPGITGILFLVIVGGFAWQFSRHRKKQN